MGTLSKFCYRECGIHLTLIFWKTPLTRITQSHMGLRKSQPFKLINNWFEFKDLPERWWVP